MKNLLKFVTRQYVNAIYKFIHTHQYKTTENKSKLGRKTDILINCHFETKRLKLKPIDAPNT